LVVGAAAALGLFPASAAPAVPATGLATASASALSTASAPTPALTAVTGGIVAPIGGGVIKLPDPPLFPGMYTMQVMPLSVTIAWLDRSSDEQRFVLYKRDLHGAWQAIYEVPTRDMAGSGSGRGDYSYIDTDRSISGQCYMVAAVGQNGAGYTKEKCTVRPD